jgi:drug/metabolite transporter (DMT)-like permease
MKESALSKRLLILVLITLSTATTTAAWSFSVAPALQRRRGRLAVTSSWKQGCPPLSFLTAHTRLYSTVPKTSSSSSSSSIEDAPLLVLSADEALEFDRASDSTTPLFVAQLQTTQLGLFGLSSTTIVASTTAESVPLNNEKGNEQDDNALSLSSERVYQQGLVTIAFITLLFASNSPALHALYAVSSSPVTTSPPVLLLNAVCSVIALVGMLAVGPFLTQSVQDQPVLLSNNAPKSIESIEQGSSSNSVMAPLLVGKDNKAFLTEQTSAGVELGLYKFGGTLANVYGLSLTTASHGAFLIQLTTLMVPLAQGMLGVAIPARIWTAIGLALTGVALFTMDSGSMDAASSSSSSSLVGDAACVGAAVLYATYDLRLFHWGQRVDPLTLITTKIVTQTMLSLAVLAAFGAEPSLAYIQSLWANHDNGPVPLVLLVALWSGLAVNAVAPYLQVGGQQAVGPARAQILYASQPLWACVLSVACLGETVGTLGLVGAVAFLSAMMLAATAPVPDPNCEQEICEV